MASNDRRRFLQTVGAGSVGLTFAGQASGHGITLDSDALDVTSDAVQEALLVVEGDRVVNTLNVLGIDYREFRVLPLIYVEAPGRLLKEVALLDAVRRIEPNRELEWFNDDARDVTGASMVQDSFTGSRAHVAVVDSGADPAHPDLDLTNNYQWVGNPLGSPTLFVQSPVDTDEIGHGTHCSGTVAGSGVQSDGRYRGMAPDTTLTAYSTGATVSVLKSAAAYDHVLATHGDTVDIVSNSYGASSADDFDAELPMNIATAAANDSGLLSVFAAGNSGPAYDTLNDYAKAPWVLGVAATDDAETIADFSSRGRPDGNHDRSRALSNGTGLYRPGICAPGVSLVSTMSPLDPLQAADDGTNESLSAPFYAALSGTSMSTPCIAGVAALAVDAARSNGRSITPLDLVATFEDTADGSYETAAGGLGFVDAAAVVNRAASGDLSSL